MSTHGTADLWRDGGRQLCGLWAWDVDWDVDLAITSPRQ